MERVRLYPVLVAVLVQGCAYPEYDFVEDATAPDTAVDSVVADTTTETIARDSGADTTMAESAPCGGACVPSEPCVEGACRPFASCAALHAALPTIPRGAYQLDPDGTGPLPPFNAYCEMADDGGGWTLALKLDGGEKTFTYDSPLWTNKETHNATATALDTEEAKLASYYTIPFTKLRLGMQYMGTRRWISLDVAGTSLRDVIAGASIKTKAGRAEWRKLLPDPLLQQYCDSEGTSQDNTAMYTYAARLRIGIVGNNEMDCNSPDSYIGFGGGFIMPHSCVGAEPGVVVGNYNPAGCGNTPADERITKAFGFVLIR